MIDNSGFTSDLKSEVAFSSKVALRNLDDAQNSNSNVLPGWHGCIILRTPYEECARDWLVVVMKMVLLDNIKSCDSTKGAGVY